LSGFTDRRLFYTPGIVKLCESPGKAGGLLFLFTKGDERINRRGRPKKGQALTDILNYKLDQKTETGKLQREAVAEKLIDLALEGDMTTIRYVMDRVDGRPKETVALESAAIESKLLEVFNHG
jgi:hypothetical protein